jgi:hypothetical protein
VQHTKLSILKKSLLRTARNSDALRSSTGLTCKSDGHSMSQRSIILETTYICKTNPTLAIFKLLCICLLTERTYCKQKGNNSVDKINWPKVMFYARTSTLAWYFRLSFVSPEKMSVKFWNEPGGKKDAFHSQNCETWHIGFIATERARCESSFKLSPDAFISVRRKP